MYVNEFFWVEGAVVVDGLGEGGWKEFSSGVNGLPDFSEVYSPSNLLDQNRG